MNTNPPIRILCVDDHPLLREGITALLEDEHDFAVIAGAADGREAVEQFRLHRPDVTLMDLQMPGMGGIEAIMSIRREFPGARILVLTTYKGGSQAMRALRAGAMGYLLKSMLRKELIEAIRCVHAGRRCIPAAVAAEIAEHAADEVLTMREVEILQRVAAGNANKEVAAQLRISEDTVKSHVKNILAKLGANDRTHAVTIALNRGLISV